MGEKKRKMIKNKARNGFKNKNKDQGGNKKKKWVIIKTDMMIILIEIKMS